MLLYVTLGSGDLERSRSFYDPVMATLGFVCLKTDDREIGYGRGDGSRCRLWVVLPFDGKPASHGNGAMTALAAPDRKNVDAFHAAALANGGTDEGRPGIRPFHANFYACYVRDPDGNKLSAVCEDPV